MNKPSQTQEVCESCSSSISYSNYSLFQLYYFRFCMSIIVFVSVIDVYFSIKLQKVLIEFEENPIGRWLMHLDGGDVALFMSLKTLGLIIVLAILHILFERWRKASMVCSTFLAIFQIGLLIYLTN